MGTAVTLKGPRAMERFHAPTQVWRADPGGRQVAPDLPAGGGVLVRLKEQTDKLSAH